MKKFILVVTSAFFFLFAYAQHDHGGDAVQVNNQAFNSIKNLVGEWAGTQLWIGVPSSKGPMNAKYYLTGNGTAVIEDLIANGKAVMSSVYHLDGPDLRVTHYCGAGNQPRLRAGAFNSENKSVSFQFVDITNLANPDAAHVTALQLWFTDINKLTIIFTFTKSGVDHFEQVDLTRSK